MLEDKLSVRAKAMKRSEIRELLKLIARPGIISFAGGMPDPTLFPLDLVEEATTEVLRKEGETALQYGATEGDAGLREEIVRWHKEREGVEISLDQVMITTASQQGLDLVTKIFVDSGDGLVVGYPTYLGGLQAFNSYGAKLYGVSLDDKGMRTDILRDVLEEMKGLWEIPKFIYIVPDFQNPSGVTMTEERRKETLELARKYDTFILSDTPYRVLRYKGTSSSQFFALGEDMERVVSVFSFSKILFPGFRLGYVIAKREIIDKLVMAKQATDLCTPPFTQAIVRRIMQKDALTGHIEKLVSVYSKKLDAMLSALSKYMPELPGLSWTKPDGGLFLWLTLPKGMDTGRMFETAIANKVAYVVGSAFHHDGGQRNTMRLNFSYPGIEEIEEGIGLLAKVISEESRA
ncbi:PLP-dependent aminotransferase family protein [candidate division WOR-3 bacterium]|nr:PLP-dependent aminotransferase family protein [candidate division WOR-3 bacterium]